MNNRLTFVSKALICSGYFGKVPFYHLEIFDGLRNGYWIDKEFVDSFSSKKNIVDMSTDLSQKKQELEMSSQFKLGDKVKAKADLKFAVGSYIPNFLIRRGTAGTVMQGIDHFEPCLVEFIVNDSMTVCFWIKPDKLEKDADRNEEPTNKIT